MPKTIDNKGVILLLEHSGLVKAGIKFGYPPPILSNSVAKTTSPNSKVSETKSSVNEISKPPNEMLGQRSYKEELSPQLKNPAIGS
jgi:hypothetical protein